MKYKPMQVYTPVKNIVVDLKKELNFRNESEVIAYLFAIREQYKEKITLIQHQDAIKRVEEILNQVSI